MYLGSKLLDGQYNLLFNVTENLCDVATNMKKAKIGEIMRPLWEQHTNIPIGCPIDAVSIYYTVVFMHIFFTLKLVTLVRICFAISMDAMNNCTHC